MPLMGERRSLTKDEPKLRLDIHRCRRKYCNGGEVAEIFAKLGSSERND